jgi:transcriptional regulator with XRE-family HTH domain
MMTSDPGKRETSDDSALSEADDALMKKVRSCQPEGPDGTAFWEALAHRAGVRSPRGIDQEEAVRLANLALAINRRELNLGKYLCDLRSAAGISRRALGREASLSPDAIGEIEGTRTPITAIDPERLAKLAVKLGAFKRVLVELIRQASSGVERRPSSLSPRLTRLDTYASRLESERAVRRTGHTGTVDIEDYVSRFIAAFDVEMSRTRQA